MIRCANDLCNDGEGDEGRGGDEPQGALIVEGVPGTNGEKKLSNSWKKRHSMEFAEDYDFFHEVFGDEID